MTINIKVRVPTTEFNYFFLDIFKGDSFPTLVRSIREGGIRGYAVRKNPVISYADIKFCFK